MRRRAYESRTHVHGPSPVMGWLCEVRSTEQGGGTWERRAQERMPGRVSEGVRKGWGEVHGMFQERVCFNTAYWALPGHGLSRTHHGRPLRLLLPIPPPSIAAAPKLLAVGAVVAAGQACRAQGRVVEKCAPLSYLMCCF